MRAPYRPAHDKVNLAANTLVEKGMFERWIGDHEISGAGVKALSYLAVASGVPINTKTSTILDWVFKDPEWAQAYYFMVGIITGRLIEKGVIDA